MISPKVFWISEKKLVTESYFSEESCNNIKQKYVRLDIFFRGFYSVSWGFETSAEQM